MTAPRMLDLFGGAHGTTERWLPVVGHEGYEVSELGRVRGLDRVVMRSNGSPQAIVGRILTPQASNKQGHLHVTLDGRCQHRVHVLVLEAFAGSRPPGMFACHWDDDPTNNHLSNLRWATPSGNMHDRVRNGTHPAARKTHCPRRHLLDTPNLVPSKLRKGGRQCLACSRARNYLQGHPSENFQIVSDRYYAELVPTGEASQ